MTEPTNTRCGAITVVVAVAVRLYRDGLAATLSAHERLCVAGTAATPLEAERLVRDVQPDVIIVDVGLDDVYGLIRTLRTDNPKSHILAFAVREEITAILEYAAAGADGFVTGGSSVPELVQAIERIAAGELLCSPHIAAQLLRRAAERRGEPSSLELDRVLTSREQEVLTLLKQGRSNKEIATALHIASATVKNHVHHLLGKLQVATRGQAIAAGPMKPAVFRASTRHVG